jgi:hypothetical protein
MFGSSASWPRTRFHRLVSWSTSLLFERKKGLAPRTVRPSATSCTIRAATLYRLFTKHIPIREVLPELPGTSQAKPAAQIHGVKLWSLSAASARG